jgi:translation elongation factor P/translation initiation factor 5A
VALFNDSWNIQPGVAVPVHVTIDGDKYDLVAAEVVEHGRQGAAVFTKNRKLFDDIRKKQTMTVYANGEPVTAIDLTLTGAAADQVIACEAAQK